MLAECEGHVWQLSPTLLRPFVWSRCVSDEEAGSERAGRGRQASVCRRCLALECSPAPACELGPRPLPQPPPPPRVRAEPGRRPALCPPGATWQPPAWEQPHGPGGPERLPTAARPLLASPPARCCGQFGVQHAQGLRPVLEAHRSPSHVAVGTRDSTATSDGSRPPSCLPPGW